MFSVFFFLFLSSVYSCSQPSCIFALNNSVSKIPAIYAFGDSYIDSGNNKFLDGATATFNYLPCGIDFQGGRPTGRTTNGRTVVDFIAESAGLPFPPPVKSLSKDQLKSTLTGINYGSSSSGIRRMPPHTAQIFVKVLSLKEQIKLFEQTTKSLKGQFESNESFALHLSNSLFFLHTGTNDLSVYWDLDEKKGFPNVEKYIRYLSKEFKKKLEKIYGLGARKFVVNNVSPFGCHPYYLHSKPHSTSCLEEMNRRAVLFNDLLSDILTVLEKSLKGTTFILCDLYKLFEDVHALPETYGFRNVVDSCCIDVAGNQTRECAPGRAPCADRTTHAYFDPFHPSESMHKLWFQSCFMDIK
ncbi:Detected protein of unknown function [Hibiscus syriacus]|uniref:GDSL esterase/lipase n=1 Tax=Hibiscus syriacus TaxID=106335 RepID=A0A6A3CLN0_HIBSY|nr:Detected protein of unknown function [Hibiscus syriacus]